MTEKEYILHAMSESRRSASLWFRYLNKMLTSKNEEKYKKELQKFLSSDIATPFQKIIIKVVLTDKDWLAFTKGLSEKADASWIKEKYGL